MRLSIASYNVHSGIGTDGRFDLRRVCSVLEEIGADIVALQECGDFRGRTDDADHPEMLAGCLRMHMAYGPNVVRDGRRYGNAILSRLPILKSRNYDLSYKNHEPRGALRCDLDIGEGRPLHVFCLHLGLTVRERRAQQAMLLSADILRDAVRADPVIVCGDFNIWWSTALPPLVRQQLYDAAIELERPLRTYPSKLPLLRLDRIYVDRGVRPVALHVHRSSLAQRASDHLPLVMTFEAPAAVAPERGVVEVIA